MRFPKGKGFDLVCGIVVTVYLDDLASLTGTFLGEFQDPPCRRRIDFREFLLIQLTEPFCEPGKREIPVGTFCGINIDKIQFIVPGSTCQNKHHHAKCHDKHDDKCHPHKSHDKHDNWDDKHNDKCHPHKCHDKHDDWDDKHNDKCHDKHFDIWDDNNPEKEHIINISCNRNDKKKHVINIRCNQDGTIEEDYSSK